MYGADNVLQKHNLASKKVQMNYDNYEKKIVEVYAVTIDGWTYGKSVCNPGKIGRREHLITLLDALVTGRCSWVMLSDDEVSERVNNNRKRQASGEQVYKPRKAIRQRKSDSAKSTQIIPDSDLEDSEEYDDNEQSDMDGGADSTEQGAGNAGEAE